jgi:hypothetical protein
VPARVSGAEGVVWAASGSSREVKKRRVGPSRTKTGPSKETLAWPCRRVSHLAPKCIVLTPWLEHGAPVEAVFCDGAVDATATGYA